MSQEELQHWYQKLFLLYGAFKPQINLPKPLQWLNSRQILYYCVSVQKRDKVTNV